MKKLSNTEAELKKKFGYKKSLYAKDPSISSLGNLLGTARERQKSKDTSTA